MTRAQSSLSLPGQPGVLAARRLPTVTQLLPHRGEMLFVDQVLHTDFAGNGAVQATLVSKKAYFTLSGAFASHWLIEIMAQAVGCIFTLQECGEVDGGSRKLGYLVAIDDYRFFSGECLGFGSILVIEVHLIHAFYPIGQYRAAVCVNGVEVAHSTMKFMTDDERSLPFDVS